MIDKLPNGINKRPDVLTSLPERPTKHHTHSLHVRHNDTDTLYHSNQSSYFTYCMEAATEASKKGCFRVLTKDLLSYPIETMECLYKGESHPGDELVISVWENPSNLLQICCQIEKQDKVIWIGTVQFTDYEEPVSKL